LPGLFSCFGGATPQKAGHGGLVENSFRRNRSAFVKSLTKDILNVGFVIGGFAFGVFRRIIASLFMSRPEWLSLARARQSTCLPNGSLFLGRQSRPASSSQRCRPAFYSNLLFFNGKSEYGLWVENSKSKTPLTFIIIVRGKCLDLKIYVTTSMLRSPRTRWA
jgi:hypothetical protein